MPWGWKELIYPENLNNRLGDWWRARGKRRMISMLPANRSIIVKEYEVKWVSWISETCGTISRPSAIYSTSTECLLNPHYAPHSRPRTIHTIMYLSTDEESEPSAHNITWPWFQVPPTLCPTPTLGVPLSWALIPYICIDYFCMVYEWNHAVHALFSICLHGFSSLLFKLRGTSYCR